MIARISHRITAAADAADYQAHLETEELPARRTAAGSLGAHLLRRVEAGRAHFVLLSLWDSPASVRKFLSEEAARAAREGPAAGAELAEAEPFVGDFEVVSPQGREPGGLAGALARAAACAPGDPAGLPSGGPSTGFGGQHGSVLCGAVSPRRESPRGPPPPGRGRAGGR